MSNVFIIQDQQHFADDGILKSRFDFEPARAFGELIFILSPTARSYSPSIVLDVYKKLSKFQSSDYLLLNGSPIFIGLAFSVASKGGTQPVNILQWDKRKKNYDPLYVDSINKVF